MSKKVINHVYLDMDGVLSDFDFETVNELKSKGEWQHDGFPKFVKNKGFEKLPMMHDAQMLLDFLKNSGVPVTLLSSAGDPGDNYDEIVAQKKAWLKKHNINLPAIIVRNRHMKKDHASKHSLLIDDTKSNSKEFKEAGGRAITHKSALHTIEKICRKYLLMNTSSNDKV
jgi:hypothetical protein